MKNIISISIDEIDSTQNLAKELIKKEKYSYYDSIVIIAKKQTHGRGQRLNTWSSQDGGLYLTFATKTEEKNLKAIQDLSTKIAEIVSNLIQENYNIKTEIKQPNDVYAYTNKGKRKISGILIETTPIENMRWILIGIGVNFHNPLPNELEEKATNIYSITHKKHNINSFAKKLIEKITKMKDELFNTY